MCNIYLNIKRIRNLISVIIIVNASCNFSSSRKDFYVGNPTKPPGGGCIEGYILNSKTELPVPGALIKLSNGKTKYTDTKGYYFFDDLPVGILNVNIKADGYLQFEKQINIYKSQALGIDFRIFPITGPGVSVTVATYNVRDFDNEDSYMHTADFIKRQNVDIIVFEEIQPSDQIGLNKELMNNEIYMTSIEFNYEQYNDHISVWSKYPVSQMESIIKGSYRDPITFEKVFVPRYIFRFKVLIDEHEIWFYGCHMKAGADDEDLKKRRAQAYALAEYIKNNHDEESENIVIVGDMNTVTDADLIEQGTLGYLTFTYDNFENKFNDFSAMNYTYLSNDRYTYHSYYKSIIDHIIISAPLLEKYIDNSVDVVHPEGDPSDHYPVLLRLYFDL
jgi:exonuclease III